MRSKRPSLTRSSRSASVTAFRTLPLRPIADPPSTISRAAPPIAARIGPTARTASSTRPTISIRALERENVTTIPPAMTASAAASAASSPGRRRTHARARAARIPIAR